MTARDGGAICSGCGREFVTARGVSLHQTRMGCYANLRTAVDDWAALLAAPAGVEQEAARARFVETLGRYK